MTAEEFYDWWCRPENQDKNWELDRGRVVEVPFGSKRHGFVCANVCWLLGNIVIEERCGYLCANNTGVALERSPDTVFGPDVGFYDGRFPTEEKDWFAVVPPRLAVEVLDSDDKMSAMTRRVGRYLKGGVSLVWLVDPEVRAVTIYRADSNPVIFAETEELTGNDVLPGFRCRVAELFGRPGDPINGSEEWK